MAFREYLPPRMVDGLRILLGRATRLQGPYASWQAAAAASAGYGDPRILRRVVDATRAVREGQAHYEQDGMLFHQPAAPTPAAAGLLLAAARAGALRVLDVGGSLGSFYLRHRKLLSQAPGLQWAIVEQPSFVSAGTALWAGGPLTFHATIAEAAARVRPTAVLFSSSLQYMPDPAACAREVASLGAEVIVVDRTPAADVPRDVVVVQAVPRAMYRASYPCWIFSRDSLPAAFGSAYEEIQRYATADPPASGAGVRVSYAGSILARRARTS